MSLYLGSYTTQDSAGGISLLREDGTLFPVAELPNASYLIFNREKSCAYAVCEQQNFEGHIGGAVASFRVQAKQQGIPSPAAPFQCTGTLPVHGKDPCHLCLSPQQDALYVANYTTGSLTVFALTTEGKLDREIAYRQHARQGCAPGVDPIRQEGPHLHFAAPEPSGRLLWTVDLGLDTIFAYAMNDVFAPVGMLSLPTGCGPRHLVFAPALPLAYVVQELTSEVLVVTVENGLPGRVIQRISTLPTDFTGISYAAAIRISGNGRRVYVSNRGDDSVACFTADTAGGLALLGCVPSGGHYPRDILLSAKEEYLFCAHQLEGGVTRLPITKDGLPGPAQQISTQAAVCLAMD